MQDKNIFIEKFYEELFNNLTLDDGVSYISTNLKMVIGAARCSIFIYNEEENELWSTLADGVTKIVIPYDIGIIGDTIKSVKPIIENSPYDNKNFLSDIDMQTGYYTQNILTSPLVGKNKNVIGAIQLLNKEDGFTKKDKEILSFLASYISRFIEIKS